MKLEGKYSIELFKPGGEGAGLEEIPDRHDNLTIARAIYRGRVAQLPGRLSPRAALGGLRRAALAGLFLCVLQC
jgi:hypothetical protein